MFFMLDGFFFLLELKIDKFDYSINRGKVIVIVDLEDFVRFLGEGMIFYDVKMIFRYNKNIFGGRWWFNVEGEFIFYNDLIKFFFIFYSLIFVYLFNNKKVFNKF